MESGHGVERETGRREHSERSRWGGFTGYGSRVAAAVAAVVIASAASATTLAASGYSVRVSASSPVAAGRSFGVKASGVAQQQALLYLYLDRKACLATWEKEAQRVGSYQSGESYFLHKDGGPPKEPFDYTYVSGSFKNSFTGHAGTAIGREHACAYLATKNKYGGYRINAANGSAGYTVKH